MIFIAVFKKTTILIPPAALNNLVHAPPVHTRWSPQKQMKINHLIPRQSAAASRPGRRRFGFSIAEVVTVVALLGTLAGVSVAVVSHVREDSATIKLRSDTGVINSAVQIYLAGGGRLEAGLTPDQVIARLKTTTKAADARTIVGLRESMIDPRTKTVAANDSGGARAVWDEKTSRFVVKSSGDGVRAFVLDDDAASEAVKEDARKTPLSFARTGSWVWDFSEQNADTGRAPSDLAGEGSVGGLGRFRGGAPAGDSVQQPLLPPLFSLPDSTFYRAQYPQTLTLSNPNPAGSSQVYYKLNEGSWQFYSAPISLPISPATKIHAYSRSIDPEHYFDSSSEFKTFIMKPSELLPPVISTPGGTFAYSSFPLPVTIANPNGQGASVVMYKINGGAWTTYAGPFNLTGDLTTNVISTYAKSTLSDEWSDSRPVSDSYIVTPVPLKAPVFSTPPGLHPYGDFPLTLAISNPNPAGSSTLKYRLDSGSWQKYTAPLTLTSEQLNHTIETFAESTNPDHYTTSDTKGGTWGTIFFAGDPSGSFHDPVGPPTLKSSLSPGESNMNFTWGEPAAGTREPNSLRFTAGDRFLIAPEQEFKLGEIDYYNGTTATGTNATSVSIRIKLKLSQPSQDENLDFALTLQSTPNRGVSADADADFVWIPQVSSPFKATVQGKVFYLKLSFGGSGPNGFTTVSEFHVHEGKTARGTLMGRFTTTP